MSRYQTHNVKSEVGAEIQIEYRNFDVKSYGCAICDKRSGYRDNIQHHIEEEHSIKEKLQTVAEEMGFDDESRIDRFKKVQQMSKSWQLDELTTRYKRKPPKEESPVQTEPGLNSAG